MSFKVGDRVQVVNDSSFVMAGKQGIVCGQAHGGGYWSVQFGADGALEKATYRAEDLIPIEAITPPKPSFKVGDRVRVKGLDSKGYRTHEGMLGIISPIQNPPGFRTVLYECGGGTQFPESSLELIEQPTMSTDLYLTYQPALEFLEAMRKLDDLRKTPSTLHPKERGAGIARLDLKPPARAPMRHQTALWDPYGNLDLLADDAP